MERRFNRRLAELQMLKKLGNLIYKPKAWSKSILLVGAGGPQKSKEEIDRKIAAFDSVEEDRVLFSQPRRQKRGLT